MSDVSETVFIGVRIDRETADKIRALADENERSVAAETRLALRSWIAEQSPRAA